MFSSTAPRRPTRKGRARLGPVRRRVRPVRRTTRRRRRTIRSRIGLRGTTTLARTICIGRRSPTSASGALTSTRCTRRGSVRQSSCGAMTGSRNTRALPGRRARRRAPPGPAGRRQRTGHRISIRASRRCTRGTACSRAAAGPARRIISTGKPTACATPVAIGATSSGGSKTNCRGRRGHRRRAARVWARRAAGRRVRRFSRSRPRPPGRTTMPSRSSRIAISSTTVGRLRIRRSVRSSSSTGWPRHREARPARLDRG
jgi:hypothetical protein